MEQFYLTRKQLQSLGLSAYLSRLISLDCPVQHKQGNANAYRLTDLRLAAQRYSQRLRIRIRTKAILQDLIQQLLQWESNVVAAPFGTTSSENRSVVVDLINKASETSKFQLRAMELRENLKHV